MFTNIKATDKGIEFKADLETRKMTKDAAIAQVNFKIKGFISFEKAIKSAVDFAIIRFRDAKVKAAKTSGMSDDEWLKAYDGKTIELDIENILTGNSQESNPIKKVAKVIANADNEKLIAGMLAKGLTREQAELAINSFLS